VPAAAGQDRAGAGRTASATGFGSPLCPKAKSTLSSGPAMKPSSDIVTCQVSLLMVV
jgi:hypothetical protein